MPAALRLCFQTVLALMIGWACGLGFAQSGSSSPPAEDRRDGLITLDLNDVDIRDALRMLADLMRTNIATARGVHGRVTLHLQDIAPEEGFRAVLAATGNRAEREGGVIIVYPLNAE